MCVGIHLYNRHIFIRHYDDVLLDEYNEYLDYIEHKSCLQGERMPRMQRDTVDQ